MEHLRGFRHSACTFTHERRVRVAVQALSVSKAELMHNTRVLEEMTKVYAKARLLIIMQSE